ncbi:MAG TPA: caspase family protein [Kofleriaceae bacterium]|nr:caspase family protein [Kofleriaceae bacterium]
MERPGRNLIAVIGIDRYQQAQHWRPLLNAVNDAREAVALFKGLGFAEVAPMLTDDFATGRRIQALATDELVTLSSNDSLVLFYAGHGGGRRHHLDGSEVTTGYLIPVDADDRVSTWINLDAWLYAVALLPARHILVILDACHSGIALNSAIRWRNNDSFRDEALATLNARRSRRVITSGLSGQAVLDNGPLPGHSLFTGCLIDALTHGLKKSGRLMITGSELGLYVQRHIETYSCSHQTPDFGAFAFDARGEMMIPIIDQSPTTVSVSDDVFAQHFGHPHPTAKAQRNPSAIYRDPVKHRPWAYAKIRGMSIKLVTMLTLAIFSALALIIRARILDKPIRDPVLLTGFSVEADPMLVRSVDGARVLWIDDHPENNMDERRAFESWDIKFLLAVSNVGGLELVKTRYPDLVISDMIRGRDVIAGYALLESLRQQGISIPVIIYSEYCSAERHAEARRLGAFACTSDPSELREYVLAALKASHS